MWGGAPWAVDGPGRRLPPFPPPGARRGGGAPQVPVTVLERPELLALAITEAKLDLNRVCVNLKKPRLCRGLFPTSPQTKVGFYFCLNDYDMCCPPLMAIFAPVTKAASSEAR